MQEGFFAVSSVTTKPINYLGEAKCHLCKLDQTCHSPKMKTSGEGRKGILIVGEAPGREEDERGEPFIGPSGQMLEMTLARVGINLRKDCWITNAAICRPKDNKLPPAAVVHCRPNVIKEIQERQPETIILLGAKPIQSVIGCLWKEEIGAMGAWAGWKIPDQQFNTWICPTWHPSYIMRTENDREKQVLKLFFERHLKEAVSLKGRPWKKVPDWTREVEVIRDSNHAAQAISEFSTWEEGPVAFDYETNMLKPDSTHSRIVSCSMSNGKRTISYEWIGDAIETTGEFLRSPVGKIASNLDFEEHWTRRHFGHGVTNWDFDTMLGAHTLDSRRDITSIKFQAFVLLGMGAYNSYMEPYFKSKGNNDENRIKEIDKHSLLLYNGLDSLLEWHTARIQKKQFER